MEAFKCTNELANFHFGLELSSDKNTWRFEWSNNQTGGIQINFIMAIFNGGVMTQHAKLMDWNTTTKTISNAINGVAGIRSTAKVLAGICTSADISQTIWFYANPLNSLPEEEAPHYVYNENAQLVRYPDYSILTAGEWTSLKTGIGATNWPKLNFDWITEGNFANL